MNIADRNHDFDIGFVAGVWSAQNGVDCNEETIKLEANERYEQAIHFIVLERSSFVQGFISGYGSYFAGLV